jgi:hypothetical protein
MTSWVLWLVMRLALESLIYMVGTGLFSQHIGFGMSQSARAELRDKGLPSLMRSNTVLVHPKPGTFDFRDAKVA